MADDSTTDRTTFPLTEVPHSAACGCGCDDEGIPELDVRSVPHAIRHATVIGALDVIPAGGAMVLVAPHDPKPLLAQIARREGDAVQVSYLESGPEAWRLRLDRVRAADPL
ncbi:hypothetical protein BN12_2510003 [Nostocoides japonicum T1-X7]|uniref:DUF2249 domain-containing protein n=1 Tax=Nostocoides japonicum T1-X7 TaxID=1194083 RepID=A0A077LWJ4_9MICO|nr:DUF2249 domain-containing protein [Tetrasphaera japonica]CCH78091.1 hypothetical protein BN12_2510003 [Tetrasphaera japonica T1-X7]